MVQTSNTSLDKHPEYSVLSPTGKTKIEKRLGKPLVCAKCQEPIEAGKLIKFSSKRRRCYHAPCYESMLID